MVARALLTTSPMLVASGLVVAVALASSPATSLDKIERRAGIMSGVGFAFAVGGAVAMGLGASLNEPKFTIGGGALIGVGLHVLALAVVAWLWPDDSWLGLVTDQTTPVGATAWWLPGG